MRDQMKQEAINCKVRWEPAYREFGPIETIQKNQGSEIDIGLSEEDQNILNKVKPNKTE